MDITTRIRNFAIVAHIDHGKSTLADRLLESTHTIDPRNMMEQVLDSNPIERERGITIKLAPVKMKYVYKGEEYILNLIDTPGHVDFCYEVSRSLSACEGIILVVDATQGIQAQTVAHMNLIKNKNLKVIPIINKIDLPSADPQGVRQSLIRNFLFNEDDILLISAKAKEAINIDKVLAAVIEKIPSPASGNQKLRALVFSSVYDNHLGVVVYVRIVDGEIDQSHLFSQANKNSGKLTFFASGAKFTPIEIGIFNPARKKTGRLLSGEVGYIATGMKDLNQARVGDTIYRSGDSINPLPGYKKPQSMVFLSFFPLDNNDFLLLRQALEKLQLSDSSFSITPHSSLALGKGFLCGFLGLLHAEVLKERLMREFYISIVATAPTVEYKVSLKSDKKISIHTPEDFPNPTLIKIIEEPIMTCTIYSPSQYVGPIMQLCQDKRAVFINLEYLDYQAKLIYQIPLSEMIVDFFERMKSLTEGYASFDYEFYNYMKVDAVRLDILINRKVSDAFSRIVVKQNVQAVANQLANRLKELIPRHQFQIPIQAAIGGKIIARSNIPAYRKDVTSKLYGGDRTRKDKLLEAQKKGKKRMKMMGNVNIPQNVFLEVYKSND